MTYIIQNFGPNLTRLRKERGISQVELSNQLQIGKQSISDYEKQKAFPTFANLDKIAEYFRATPTQLFGTIKEIELENSVLETDTYTSKADHILKSVKEFYELTNYLNDFNSPEFYTSETINNLYHLITPKPILDPETDEQLMRFIPTGKLVRAEDISGNPEDYELAFKPSPLTQTLSRIDEINELYEKVRFVEAFKHNNETNSR
ncbi:TPA: helix-turn-helix transcriptional regulator [Streptococcus agalactiae]|jgi:Helix-turn-helix.|uniref:Transcriptional regulator, Cro/CI family n=2 Tax=Streptococcus TaxID=1301 RepID=Q8DX63_STRA5|nr:MULTISPECIES: helix-turn-helix transcriptional regulator [Streptococcus]HEO8209551.1 helix-turn-helix transcriptional regulator [Streptococcus agalactiae ADL-350]AAN00851.1 transcriptional regulator, Cro/CI family [Streptococcus agalactiae 2603V/R]AYY67832.1 XRE family transcriptional regulator [Streptococcus sp. FDAARGOS_521]EPT64304.1 transcriptional regulator [Streptococcus agalactiae CCUG 37741]EPT67262.1 transcriptional regulator [Streptococcus agalactiae CCUG 37742]